MANLAAKYRPRTLEDVTEQSLVIDMVRNLCSKSELESRNFLFTGPAGCGKAQPLYSSVLTPSGFIHMGEVQLGTEVITGRGNRAKVSGVYPQGERDIYEIKLTDGTTVRVADNHLNLVYRYNEDKKMREDFVLTTTDLIDLFKRSRFKLRIDIPKVDWEYVRVPIDPYLLGFLIGDGSLSSGNLGVSNGEPDVIAKVDAILRRDWDCTLHKVPGDDNVDYSIVSIENLKYVFYFEGNKFSANRLIDRLVELGYPKFDSETLVHMFSSSTSYSAKKFPELVSSVRMEVNERARGVSRLRAELKNFGLLVPSHQKYIPDIYLRNSKEVRVSLLQGLFDTDGYIGGGTPSYSTSSPRLSDDFAFLVRSLGARDHVSIKPAGYKDNCGVYHKCKDAYEHTFKFCNGFDYCTSKKHTARVTEYQHPPMRNIVSIDYVGKEVCQCIMVDHEDHSYISDGFIPTHNTTICRIISNIINGGKGSPIEIDAASHSGVDAMREIVQQAQSYPVGCDWKTFIVDECHAISSQGWQTLLKTLEEGPAKTVFLMATTNPEKIPATIISRVQTFQLSKISLAGIESRLKYIVEQENKAGAGITYEDSALSFIAKMANGGMRDSITLLEKAIAYDKNITSVGLVSALGLPNYDDFFALLQAYAKKDNIAISSIVDRVYNSGINFVKWMSDFHSFVVNVMKYIFLQDINKTTIPAQYQEKISKYGQAHCSICIQLANILVKLNYELKTTQYLQELTLTYLCFNPKTK